MEISWIYTLLSFFVLLLAFKHATKSKLKLPPSPVLSFPLLGHIHLLKPPLNRKYKNISEKLGPIFSLRIGTRLMVVVSSLDLVNECFTKNDIVLANRPSLISMKYFSYNNTAIAFASYGDHWRNLRKLTTIQVFATKRLDTFLPIRQDEVRRQLEALYAKSKHEFTQVGLRRVFSELAFNNIMRMVAGKRYFKEGEDNEEGNKFHEDMDELFKAASLTHPVEFFPFLRLIDFQGYEKNLARISEKRDCFLQSLIDECRGSNNKDTMIGYLLSLREKEPEYYSDMIIKGIILIMLQGGTETIIYTMEWAMSALLNHPEILQRAKVELDNTVGNTRLVDESDIDKLPYLRNIILETYRLYPVAPFLLYHESADDCKIGGYDIPKETILLVNAWAIHRDPTTWNDPTSFNPENFEVGESARKKLVTFGMGRRACPAVIFSDRFIGLMLGSLIQCFEWERVGEEMLDMNEEHRAILMPKAIPLEARCKARETAHGLLAGNV